MTVEESSLKPGVNTIASESAVPDRATLAAFAGFVLISGGASVAIRFTYAEVAPLWGATIRFAIGALIFWIIALVMKLKVPGGRTLLGAAIFGALSVGLAFILISWGLVKTPASLYQILMAQVPLLTLLLASAQGLEKIHLRGVVGALLTVAGIAIAVGGVAGAEISILHIIGIIAAAACFAEAGIVYKKFPKTHPVMTNAIAMTTGAVIICLASIVTSEPWVIPVQAATWISLAYLIIGVTVVAFLLYIYILRHWTASGVSYGFVLIPLVTVVLATWLAGEQITFTFVLGALLVLLGVFVGALFQPPVKSSPT